MRSLPRAGRIAAAAFCLAALAVAGRGTVGTAEPLDPARRGALPGEERDGFDGLTGGVREESGATGGVSAGDGWLG